VQNIPLKKGVQKIKILIDNGGFNLAYIQFLRR